MSQDPREVLAEMAARQREIMEGMQRQNQVLSTELRTLWMQLGAEPTQLRIYELLGAEMALTEALGKNADQMIKAMEEDITGEPSDS